LSELHDARSAASPLASIRQAAARLRILSVYRSSLMFALAISGRPAFSISVTALAIEALSVTSQMTGTSVHGSAPVRLPPA
jgi:hypothetical protein